MTRPQLCVLVVDDDRVDQLAFARMVADGHLPYEYRLAGSTAEARALLTSEYFDIVIADYYLGDGSALDLLEDGHDDTRVPIIIITGIGNEAIAVKALKAGAYDYLIKDMGGSYLKSLPGRIDQVVTGWRAKTKLRQDQAIHQALIENSGDGVWMLDASGIITYASPSVERLLGYTVADFVGRQALDLVHPDSLAVVGAALQTLTGQPGQMIPGEYQWRHADGSWRWLAGTAKNMLDQPDVNALVVNFRDITDQKASNAAQRQRTAELERQLAEQTAALALADHEWDTLSHAVGHDLRAPLRSLTAFSTILLEDYSAQLDATGQSYMRRVHASAVGLAEMIDGLRQLSRYAHAKVQPATISLSDMAQTIMGELGQAEPARQVKYISHGAVAARGDSQLLRVALGHLLTNAWKFTGPRAAATIEFGQVEHAGRPAYFVRDNGVGFDGVYAGKLFGAFQRLHTTAEFPGLGVGLATVQRIIHQHGGQVWAEAVLDHGATFTFTLAAEH